ncbi:MAG: flagellar FlbD family protein [Planctomycetaceae bacterium]
MIKLTRLNGDEFVVNAAMIQFVESRPDTFVTLTSNERLIVKESTMEVVQRVMAYARFVRLTPEFGSAKG